MAQALGKGWLAGLKFTGSTPKKEKTENGERIRHIPFERELRPGDVLSFRLTGGGLAIVAADGKKHLVELKAADRKKLEEELAKGGQDDSQGGSNA